MKYWIAAAAVALAPWQAASATEFVAGAHVEGTAFERGLTGGASPVRYYLAPASAPRPLLVVLQGSGCGPLFAPAQGGLSATAGQDILQQLSGERFAVLVIEKPNVASERTSNDAGETGACSAAFNAAHSLENWTSAISRAIDAAMRDPRVDARAGVRVLGLSEGAVVAARVARERADVNHVTFISGFGCDQWGDMLVVARREGEGAIAETEAGLRAVATAPGATDRFFAGQTHLFWSSFGRACPAEDLARSRAAVFVAYGVNDEEIDGNGVEAIPAALLAAGRDVRVTRVAGGSHVLNTPDTPPFANLIGVFRDSLDWMAQP